MRMVELDVSQRAVANAVAAAEAGAFLVLGGPGTGKTTVAQTLILEALAAGADPQTVVMLVGSRQRAGELRKALEAQAGGGTRTPLVRTFSSLAFAIVRELLARRPDPLEPKLVTGPDQDAYLDTMLANYLRGDPPGPVWPDLDPAATTQPGFRLQLRNLFARADEFGLDPADLALMGERHGEPMWVAAAQVLAEYRNLLSDSYLERSQVLVDSSSLLDRAILEMEQAPPGALAPLGLIVVDDYHDVTAGQVAFLAALSERSRLVLLADPDLSVQGFRGGLPQLVTRAQQDRGTGLGAFGARVHTLQQPWRLSGELAQVASRIVAAIPTLGSARHRLAPSDGESDTTVRTAVFSSAAGEAAHIGALLRRAHVLEGVSYRDMCVITRSSSAARTVARRLRHAGIPVSFAGTDLALAAEPVAAALLDALDVVSGTVPLADVLTSLATSFLGGTTTLGLRSERRRLWLATDEDQRTTSMQLLVDAVESQADGSVLSRLGAVLAAGRAAFAQTAGTEGHIETVLWALWSAAGVAEDWQERALQGDGLADHDLDVALALFAAASQFDQHIPGADVASFVAHLRSRELAADALINKDRTDAVTVTTPTGAAGRQWRDVYVCGVQDGVWPDLRIRDTIFGAERLTDILLDRDTPGADPRSDVHADELRMFYLACTRATSRLLVSAVRAGEDVPSTFVSLVDPTIAEHPVITATPPATLRDIIVAARQALEAAVATGAEADARAWARFLADLTPHTSHADPGTWHVRRGPTSDEALLGPEEKLRLAPSRAQYLIECPYRFVLSYIGADVGTSLAASTGSLIHDLAEEFPTGGLVPMQERLDERWAELGLAPGWESMHQRNRAEFMVERLDTKVKDLPAPLAVEAPFRLETGDVVIAGRIDRIDSAGDGAAIVKDIKTTSSPPTGAETAENAQLAIYQWAINDGAVTGVEPGTRAVRAELMLVGTTGNDRVQPELTDDDPWVKTRITEEAVALRGVPVAVRPGAWCKHCAFKPACPAVEEGDQVHP